jgi:hypothetical protein
MGVGGPICSRGRRGRDRMVVGFTTTCAISAYRHFDDGIKYRNKIVCRQNCDNGVDTVVGRRGERPGHQF